MHALEWVILALVFGIVEAFTSGFFMLFFAAGAVITAILAIYNPALQIQLTVFLLSSVTLMVFGRPFIQRAFGISNHPSRFSNVKSLLGETALVLDPVSRYEGRVKIANSGEVWSAYLAENGQLQPGMEAVIIDIDGAKLIVRPK